MAGIIDHPLTMHGIATSLLAALTVMWALGIRYPLQMLPLFLFELIWKSIWLIAVALPLWRANQMDADTWETVQNSWGTFIILPIAIPWPYVLATYVLKPGDRWW